MTRITVNSFSHVLVAVQNSTGSLSKAKHLHTAQLCMRYRAFTVLLAHRGVFVVVLISTCLSYIASFRIHTSVPAFNAPLTFKMSTVNDTALKRET